MAPAGCAPAAAGFPVPENDPPPRSGRGSPDGSGGGACSAQMHSAPVGDAPRRADTAPRCRGGRRSRVCRARMLSSAAPSGIRPEGRGRGASARSVPRRRPTLPSAVAAPVAALPPNRAPVPVRAPSAARGGAKGRTAPAEAGRPACSTVHAGICRRLHRAAAARQENQGKRGRPPPGGWRGPSSVRLRGGGTGSVPGRSERWSAAACGRRALARGARARSPR